MTPLLRPLALLAFTPLLGGATFLLDEFNYTDGPLSGQGPWVRGVSSPTADTPSEHIVVENGAVKFDWTTPTPVNNALRVQWAEDQLTGGMIYAAFDFRATVAPQPADDVRPGFFSFDRSGGSQIRGLVGLRAGTEVNTYQLGVSASSQLGSNFVFAERDLALGVTYRVLVGYNIGTAQTDLWIDAEDTSVTPAATATGSTSTGVRRVQLRLYNADGSGGTTTLGVFYMDNLVVYTGEAVDPDPEPEPDPEPTDEVFLAESFIYTDGPLLADAEEWRRRAGTVDPVVQMNRLLMTPTSPGEGGYITRNLSRSVSEQPVYLGFTLDFPATQAIHDAVNVVFFTDPSGAFGRGFVALQGTSQGWRIGLRATSSGVVTWSEEMWSPGGSGRWVINFDPVTGQSQLWSGGSGGVPVEVAGSALSSIRRVAIGADAHMPTPELRLGDLHAASTREKAYAMPEEIAVLPHPQKLYLFLLIGQSNMAGRGPIAPEDALADRRILVFNEAREWAIAREPLHWDRPGFNGVGPAMPFARELLKSLPPDAAIGLVPAAAGGTSIAWWTKTYSGANTYYGGQYLYPHAVSRTLDAFPDGRIAGILWNQGESDGGAAENDSGAAYRTRLHQLIADLRADLDGPEIPFIVSTLGPWRNAPALNAVFLNLPNEVPFTAAVNTNDPAVAGDLHNQPDDPPHYDTPSYRLLGRLYADAFMPFWSADPAYVRQVGGLVEAGAADYRIGFSGSGALIHWETEGHSIIGDNAVGAAWFLSGATEPEALTYTPNPPLSWKWRSPRTMASWTVGENEVGVVLANNDLSPAIFSMPLVGTHLTHFRTVDGEWRAVNEVGESAAVDRLRWTFPDGRQALWRGAAFLTAAANGDFALDTPVEAGVVTDWTWHVGEVALLSPQSHAVYQRETRAKGKVLVEGVAPLGSVSISVMVSGGTSPFGEHRDEPIEIPVNPASGAFSERVELPAGGWYRMDLTVRDGGGEALAVAAVEPFGIGEVFVVAGQSNSTNSGQTATRQRSGMVAAFSGSGWRPADDPMPGTHDNAVKGSFQPAMGDVLAERFSVPIGFASTGQGGSAIRHWQPDYEPDFESSTFYNGLYSWTHYRMRQLGTGGFRALLWHQGESNAARGLSTDSTKVETYSQSLIRLLSNWRTDAGWAFPAFTAQVSLWPVENAQFGGDPYLRRAQEIVWEGKFAHPGPDTDLLGLEFRQDDSDSRVHFNAAGLKAHGEMWADILGTFIEIELNPGQGRLRLVEEEGEFVLRVLVPAGAGLVVERSFNLTQWAFWQSIPSRSAEEEIEFRDADAAPGTTRFYRLRSGD